ncbi:MAG: hypothetical protein JWM02_1217 [Frankiales bacterium]|nr:hypothetical protein [Frankiales bacterium]
MTELTQDPDLPETWSTALDAFEEWVRRTADGFATRGLDVASPPPALPAGPVPAALQLRARTVLAQLEATEKAGWKRRVGLTREQAYGVA